MAGEAVIQQLRFEEDGKGFECQDQEAFWQNVQLDKDSDCGLLPVTESDRL